MSLWFYRLAFIPVLLVLAPNVLWRMWRRGGYREDFGQRFGRGLVLPPPKPSMHRIWLQAVSVGEVLAIEPLIAALLAEPNVEVYLTTTTSTGLAVARQKYRGRVLGIGYFPLDFAPFSARAWSLIQPNLALLTEGERWPEHVHQARLRQVPVVCVNARLSDRSFRRMHTWRGLVVRLLRGINELLAVSALDAERFQAIGFPPECVSVTGNLKVDVQVPELDVSALSRLRGELGFPPQELILLGSSTWPGEEAALIDAWRAARAAGIPCRLLLVPRHEERRDELAHALREANERVHFRSHGSSPGEADITVADTTGELRNLTQLADVVFVGKSLPPHHEGQTPVEAAALGRPVLFGPRMSNFRTIARDLVLAGAAVTVANPPALRVEVLRLLGDEAARAHMGQAGREWHRRNRGALARTLSHLRKYFPRC